MVRKKRSNEIIDTITMLIRRFPGICKDANSVFEDIFCVTGNRWFWRDGIPVFDDYGSDEFENGIVKPISKDDAINKCINEQIEFEREWYKDCLESLANVLESIQNGNDLRLNKKLSVINNSDYYANSHFRQVEVYLLNENSLLCNIPDNIRDDYKWLIKEFYEDVLVYCKNPVTREFLPAIKEKIDSWNLIEETDEKTEENI